MAFKGLDFAKMSREMEERRAMSPEQKEQLQAREAFASNAQYVARDEAERQAMSKTVRIMQLAEHPSSRGDINGGMTTTLYLVARGEEPNFESGGNVKRAVLKHPEAERIVRGQNHEAVGLEKFLGNLDKGSVVTMLGEERPRRWKNEATGAWSTVREFHVARVAEGQLTRQEIEAFRHDGPAEKLVEASLAHEGAANGLEKEAIARRFLGQEPRDEVRSKGPSEAEAPLESAMARGGRDGR